MTEEETLIAKAERIEWEQSQRDPGHWGEAFVVLILLLVILSAH